MGEVRPGSLVKVNVDRHSEVALVLGCERFSICVRLIYISKVTNAPNLSHIFRVPLYKIVEVLGNEHLVRLKLMGLDLSKHGELY